MFELVILLAFVALLWLVPKYRKKRVVPSLPTQGVQVKSSSGTQYYTVDPTNLSCTCPDFTERRADFPRSDPRRLCKHLMKQIDEYSIFDLDTAHEVADVPAGRGFPMVDRHLTTINGERVTAHLPANRNRPWVNIYIGQERYGYNVDEERWAYGNNPGEEQETLGSWIRGVYKLASHV